MREGRLPKQDSSPLRADSVEAYLRSLYTGVFSEEAIRRHITDYVELESAEQMVRWVCQRDRRGQRLLDIGSGFGSFVLLCRHKDIDAVGIELSQFEVSFARKRLGEERQNDDPEYVYLKGNALELPFPSETFNVVTLLNVPEHVNDLERLLSQVERVLRPGGEVYIICPNYAAFRTEAHYHVPWAPLLPKSLAMHYLRLKGKDPRFLKSSIFYRTNWGVLAAVARHNLVLPGSIHHLVFAKLTRVQLIKSRAIRRTAAAFEKCRLLWVFRAIAFARFFLSDASTCNPFKESIVLHVEKIR